MNWLLYRAAWSHHWNGTSSNAPTMKMLNLVPIDKGLQWVLRPCGNSRCMAWIHTLYSELVTLCFDGQRNIFISPSNAVLCKKTGSNLRPSAVITSLNKITPCSILTLLIFLIFLGVKRRVDTTIPVNLSCRERKGGRVKRFKDRTHN